MEAYFQLAFPDTQMMTVVVDEDFMLSIEAVEHILKYNFFDKSLLAAALTHSSLNDSPSYQRLEFVGDAALGLAFANFVYITYPDLDQGRLSLLRASNISTEKLARVAVRNGLFHFVRHNAPSLDAKVNEFSLAIKEEEESYENLAYGGKVKAPKILADIVEAIAAAIYVDVKFDLKFMWEVFSPLLEPIVTLENLKQQPVTMLYELCQKQGKNVDIKHWRRGENNITNVFVDGKLLASACSEQKETSKLIASKAALDKLLMSESMLIKAEGSCELLNGVEELTVAKQKLIEFCGKKHWSKPTYRVENQEGPSHDRKYICMVEIETSDCTYKTTGKVKPKVKEAENSAASMMLYNLKDTKFAA
ncbi:hypothetical protein IFM89_008283 [Coptis chinensis]|uniref:Uncharacterized protein n=1 Tax=Coptis chinensis TaxID=261450 RepID=A0A835GYE4_9MAGN|nr:hypothetical protein IFM89_008283 [Coptis chinensis]